MKSLAVTLVLLQKIVTFLVRLCPVILNPFFSSLFYSIYSRAAEKRHIVLLHVRCNGGAWQPEGIVPPVSPRPLVVAQGFLLLPHLFLFCLVFFCPTHIRLVCHTTNIWVSSPVWCHTAYPLSVWETQGTPLYRPFLWGLLQQWFCFNSSVCSFCLPKYLQSACLRLQQLFQFVIHAHHFCFFAFCFVSSPICCLTLHSLIEQHSGTNNYSHIYCNHKMLACWDCFFPTPSLSWQTIAQLKKMLLRLLTSHQSRNNSEQIGWLRRVSFSGPGRVRAFKLLRDHRDKQRELVWTSWMAWWTEGVCCVCVCVCVSQKGGGNKRPLCVALVSRGGVSVCHTALTDSSPHSMRSIG